MEKSKIIESILENPMDSERWKNAGKACGWKEIVCSFCGTEVTRPGNSLRDGWCDCDMKSTKAKYEWEYHALRFHEINLTEGWEKAVEYLATLIKSK